MPHPVLRSETIADLVTVRAQLELDAARLDEEYQQHSLAAESAGWDRDQLDQQIDVISSVLGDRTMPNGRLRRARRERPPTAGDPPGSPDGVSTGR